MPQNPFEEFMRQQAQPVNEFDSFIQKEAKPRPVKPTQPKTVQKVPTRGPVRPQGPAPTFNVNPLQSMLGVPEQEQVRPTVPGSVKPAAQIPPSAVDPNKARIEAERKRFESRSWLGQQAEKMFTRFASADEQATPEAQRDLAIRRAALGVEDEDPRNMSGPRKALRQLQQGAANIIAGVPEGLGNIADIAGYVAAGAPSSETQGAGATARKYLTDPALRGAAAAAPIDKTDQDWLTAQIPQAIGSSVGLAMGGGSKFATALLGAASQVQQSLREYDRLKGDPGAKRKAIAALQALVGTSEAAGLGNIFDKFGGKRKFIELALDWGEEGLQEWFQTTADDYIMNLSGTDKTRSLNPFSANKLEAGALGLIAAGPFVGGSAAINAARGRAEAPAVRAIEQERGAPLNLTASRPGGTPTTVIPLNPSPEQAAQLERATGAIEQSAARDAAEAKADEILSLPDDEAKRQALKDAEDDPLLNEVLYQRVNQEVADIQADPSLTPVQKAQQVANARQVLAAEGIDLLPNVPTQGTPIQDRLAARPGGPVAPVERPGLTPEQQTAEVLNRQLGDEQIQVEQAKAQLARQREAQRQQSIAQAEMLNRQLAQETEVERVTRENEELYGRQRQAAADVGQRADELAKGGQYGEALAELARQKTLLTETARSLPRVPASAEKKADIQAEITRIKQNENALKQAMRSPKSGQRVSSAPALPKGYQEAITKLEAPPKTVSTPYVPATPGRKGKEDSTLPPDLLRTVRRLGGIKTTGATYGGEIAGVLSNKESGTSGIVNNKSGMDLDYMREALVGEGAIPPETTNSELLEMLDMAVRNKDRERPTGTIDEQLVAHIEEQARQTAKGSANPFEEFMQGEAEADTADWTARNAAATQASEDRRPPMGLGPERPDAAHMVSFSQYNDLVTNNKELVNQLYDMPLDEGANDRLEEGLAKIQEWADRRGIEQRHVDALEAYIRSEHLARAAAESSTEEDFIGWIDRQIEEGTAALVEEYGADAVADAEIAIEREVAALDAFYSDENTIDLFNKAKAGNDAALRRLTEYAEQEYGISGQIIADTVRAYRLATEASKSGPVRVVKTAAQIAVDETAFEDVETEISELLRQPLDGLTPADIDPYLETLEAWRNRSITRDDVPADLLRALRTKMADVNELRHIMVKAKQVPPKFRNRTLNKEQAAEKAERNKQKAEEARQRQREVRERERKRGDEPIMLPQQREALKALEGRTEPYPTLQFMSNFGLRRLAVEDLIDLGLIREVEGGVVANKPTAPAAAPLVKPQPKQTEEEPFPQLKKPLNMPMPEPELPGRNKKNESLKMRVPQPPNYRPVNFEEPAPTFYSALERFVADKKFPNKASGAQMLAMIQKPQSGIKPDEVKWLGLEDWLRPKSSVTKDEVLDFIRANNVKVEEVVKDENQGKLYRELKEAQEKVNNYNGLPAKAMQAGMSQLDAMNLPGRLQDGRKKVEDLPVEIQETAREFLEISAKYEKLKEEIEKVKENKPKYQQYVIPGATEGSYRELLLTMPVNPDLGFKVEMETMYGPEQWSVNFADRDRPGQNVTAFITEDRRDGTWRASFQNKREDFSTKEEGVEWAKEQMRAIMPNIAQHNSGYKSSHWSEPNILAHIRFNERTDADGKRVLFVEEIQSDWAQEGRKKGFRGNENANDLKKEAEPFMRRFYNGKGDMSDAAWQELSDKVSDYERRIQAAERGVPNMPFPKTDSWAMLAFKRVLRHAAENGYDRIAWTTGEQQAERYDLSKQIKSLSYNRLNRDTADEQVSIIATGLDGERVIQKVVKPEELEDVVGKELATKILEDPKGRGELTGLDLKVGGEGMKGFYDAILPAAVNKYLKKWGVKAKEGKARADDRKGGDYIVLDKIGLEVAEVDTLEDARRLVEAGEGASYMQNRRYSPAYSIDITPEMRASVMQGQPLFFREGKRADRTVTTRSGRKVSAKTPEFLTKGEIPPDAQGKNYDKVYENIGGEFAQKRRKGIPGTLYLNDHATWVLDEVELSMMEGMPGYENLKPHAYGGATVLLNDAQQMADILRDRAENLWADRPDIQKNVNGLADLIEEAITDARANGKQNSIEIVNASKDYSEILPDEYQSYLDSQKKTRRHESAHIWQTKIDPNRPGLLANSETADDVYYEKIRDALYNYYPNITHDQVYSEAFAFIASGDWARAGLTKEEAAKWLNYYFTKIAKKYGRAALAAGPKRMHPMTKGILTDVRRQTEQTRRDQGANGKSVEAAPRESLKIRRPDRSMGRRQDAGGAGGRDTGSAGQNRGGEGRGVKPKTAAEIFQAVADRKAKPQTPEQKSEAAARRTVFGAAKLDKEGKLTPERRAEAIKYADELLAAGKVNDEARIKTAATELKNATREAKELPEQTKLDKLSAAWKAGLLTGPATHLVNILSNAGFQVTEEFSRIPASMFDLLASVGTGRRTVAGPNVKALGAASWKAATEGLKHANEIMKNGVPADVMENLNYPEVEFKFRSQKVNSVLNNYVNGVFRLLSAEDQVYKAFALARSIEAQAKLIAEAEVRRGEIPKSQLAARRKYLYENPTAEMSLQGVEDSLVATFQNDNTLSNAIKSGRRQLSPGGRFTLDMFLPFDRTPTNIIARTLEMTPLGYVVGAKQIASALSKEGFTEAKQRRFAQTFGRASVGTMLMALGWKLGAMGLMSGFYDDDRNKEKLNQAVGRQPNALNLGGRSWFLGGMGPLGVLLGLGATLQREFNQKLKKPEDRPFKMLRASSEVVLNLPMMQGSRRAKEMIENPGGLGVKAGQMAGSFVPTIVSNIGDIIDPFERDTKSFLGAIGGRIPGARNFLPEKKDALGETIPNNWYGFLAQLNMIDFTRSRSIKDIPIANEMTRLDVGLNKMDDPKEFVRAGNAMVRSPIYKSAGEETQRRMIDALQRRLADGTGNTDPADIKKGLLDADERAARKALAPQAIKTWTEVYGEALRKHPRFNTLSAQAQKAALDILKDRAEEESRRKIPRLKRFNAAAIIKQAQGASY